MTKTKLAIILDNIFISIISFIVLSLWLNKYIKNAIYSLIISIILSILLFIILFKHSLKKHNILTLKNKDLKFAEKCFEELLFTNQKSTISYFEKLLNASHIKNNIFSNEKSYFYVNVKLPLTNIDFVIANEFYLENDKGKPLIFICKNTDKSFDDLNNSSPISFNTYTSIELFSLMKETNIFPIDINTNKKSTLNIKKLRNKFSTSLNRKQFKNFLISGLSLIILSIFIPYSYYYLFFGSLLLIFSIICLFNKNNKIEPIKEELKNHVLLENSLETKIDKNDEIKWFMIHFYILNKKWCKCIIFYYKRISSWFFVKNSTKSFLNFSISSPLSVWSKLERLNLRVTDFLLPNVSLFW